MESACQRRELQEGTDAILGTYGVWCSRSYRIFDVGRLLSMGMRRGKETREEGRAQMVPGLT